MGRITFEWESNPRGIGVLLARKARGKITFAELSEELSRDHRYAGNWAVIIRAREDSYQGWGDDQAPVGDVVELYRVDDEETCPVCASVISGATYCPHCGGSLPYEDA